MNKLWFHLGVVSSLAVLTTSCGGDGDKQATPVPSPSIASSPKAAAPVPAAATPAPAASPMVAATTPATPATAAKAAATQPVPGQSVTPDLAAGLIPPTDGDNWARTVPKGRPDPFGVLNLQPVESAPIDVPGQAASQPQPSVSAKAKPASPTTSATKTASASTAKTAPAITVKGSGASVAKVTSSRTVKVATTPAVATKVKKAIATKIAPIVASKLPSVASKAGGVNIPSPTGEVALDTNNPSKAKKNSLPTTVATKPIVKPIKPVGIPAKKSSPQPTVAFKPVPQPLKEVAAPGVAPTAVQPTLARTVSISGVIQSGGITQVIVKLPTESFSRYLEVGARLFDGKVKVKRVEGEQTLSPIIILEEAGIEVNRRVGDVGEGGVKEAQPK